MAGEWIKIRTDLLGDPRVFQICKATGLDKYQVAGRLVHLWSYFDTYSTDGVIKGLPKGWVDEHLQAKNIESTLEVLGWYKHDSRGGGTAILPDFDVHNGRSAKRRAMEQKKKQRQRASPLCPDAVGTTIGTTTGPDGGLEKRREEKREETPNGVPSAPPAGGTGRDLIGQELWEATETKPKSPLWTAVRDTWHLADETKTQCKRIQRLFREFKGKGATVDSLKDAVEAYRRIFPDVACTPEGVLKQYEHVMHAEPSRMDYEELKAYLGQGEEP